jgi:hypothetical protein
MATPIGDLWAAAERAGTAAAEADELRPARFAKVGADLREAIRSAILNDLVSGTH